MGDVVDLARYRRRRSGQRPSLGLIGLSASAEVILRAALRAADPAERTTQLAQLLAGSYADMFATLTRAFEISDAAQVKG